MKKFLFIAAMAIGLTATSFAQGNTVQQSATVQYKRANNTYTATRNGLLGATTDSLLNADTSYAYFQCLYRSDLLIVDSTVKVSGTPAGTTVLQGANDTITGTTWYSINSDSTYIAASVGKTYTIVNTATQVPIWFDRYFPFKYGRLVTITTGTQVCVPKYYVTGKR